MKRTILGAGFALLYSCTPTHQQFDANGYIDVDEVTISAPISGQVIACNLEDGMLIPADSVVVQIDSLDAALQYLEAVSNRDIIPGKAVDPIPPTQILTANLATETQQKNVIHSQLEKALLEQQRYENLVATRSIPRKQYEDACAAVVQLQQEEKLAETKIQAAKAQIQANQAIIARSNKATLDQMKPQNNRVSLFHATLEKTQIRNPLFGNIVQTYIHQGEYASQGSPLYSIANYQHMFVNAFINADQYSKITRNKKIDVFIDDGDHGFRHYDACIQFISRNAEYHDKTMLSQADRKGMVYRIKASLTQPDSLLKIGMNAQINLNI